MHCSALQIVIRDERTDTFENQLQGNHSSSASGTTSFRLWETKKQTGSGAVSATSNKAYTQVAKRAKEYLANLTAPLSHMPGAVGDLGKEIADLWLDADARAGVEVSVASDRVPPPATCCTTMGKPLRAPSAGM